jgi:hypothetical protein
LSNTRINLYISIVLIFVQKYQNLNWKFIQNVFGRNGDMQNWYQLRLAQPVDALVFRLPLHHGLPLAMQRLHNVDREGRVLGLAIKGKLVLWFTVGDLVDLEPFDGSRQQSWGSMSWLLFSTIFDYFWQTIWVFSWKPMLRSIFSIINIVGFSVKNYQFYFFEIIILSLVLGWKCLQNLRTKYYPKCFWLKREFCKINP